MVYCTKKKDKWLEACQEGLSFKMASTDCVLLTTELNNLRKSELIEIIISQKVPDRITSECILKYVREIQWALGKYRADEADASFCSLSSSDSVNDTVLNTPTPSENHINLGFLSSQSQPPDSHPQRCVAPKKAENLTQGSQGERVNRETVINDLLRELECTKNENLLLGRLENEMRERIDLMVYKINVLENTKNNKNYDIQIPAENNKVRLDGKSVNKGPRQTPPSSAPRQKPETQASRAPAVAPPPHHNRQQNSSTAAMTHRPADKNRSANEHATNQAAFLRIVGTGPTQGGIIASDVNRNDLTFLFVNNVSKTTSEEMLKNFFRDKQMDNIFVKKLNENDFSCSFQIGVPTEKLKAVMEPGFWAAGVTVQKYKFHSKTFFRRYNGNGKPYKKQWYK